MELSPQELFVLKQLVEGSEMQEDDLSPGSFSVDNLRGAISWLEKKGLVEISTLETEKYYLGKEGKDFLREGLPELKLVKILAADETLNVKNIMEIMGSENGKIALSQVAKFGIKPINGEVKGVVDNKIVEEIEIRQKVLAKIERGIDKFNKEETTQLENLTHRKGLLERKVKRVRILNVTKDGVEVSENVEDEATVGNLTPEMLKDGTWRSKKFREYDVKLPGKIISRNGLHPLTVLIDQVREIFLSMGFTELKDDFIELTGWNMDALFIPQDHPARDMQDTFFLKGVNVEPSSDEVELFKKIGKTHEKGIGKYSGWGYKWSMEEALKPLLRTHTTASTIRALHQDKDKEIAVFSVDKVFRHESVDWKHLAEFYQVEGAIHSKNANLSTLKWYLTNFYSRLGFDDIELIPSYYPYTEPSLDVIVKINGREVEMGGSGIVRPEVTKTLGLKHNVIAWGLGLERLALMFYGLDDIRKLYLSDLSWLQSYKIRF